MADLLKRAAATAAGSLLLCLSQSGLAGESPFGYLYSTDTQPKGKVEFEQWLTHMRGQSQGSYSANVMRSELEYGVTDDFQVAIYANYDSVRASGNKTDGTTGGRFVPDSADPSAPYRSTFYDSTSLEFIWRVLNPYKHGIGLAFYLEPTYGPKKKEIEAKILVDKYFLEETVLWSTNFVAAQEQEKYPGEWEKEAEVQFLTGVSWRFAPRWSAGVEYRYMRGYGGNTFANANREFSAQFLGPTIHYGGQGWWATATWMPQLRAAHAFDPGKLDDIASGRLYGEHFARNEFRVRFGIEF